LCPRTDRHGNPLAGNPLAGNPLADQPLADQPLAGKTLTGKPLPPACPAAAPNCPIGARPLCGVTPIKPQLALLAANVAQITTDHLVV
jgi:hypothetical protein